MSSMPTPTEPSTSPLATPPPATETKPDDAMLVEKLESDFTAIRNEIHKVIIGQEEVIEQILIALLTGGHVLITGVPGLAKTLLIKTLGDILDLSFKRIQFTPDLMPGDITGTEILRTDPQTGDRSMQFVKGPIFTNLLLADEINRTPPKTQSALLQAMQELVVTAEGENFPLEPPFFVMATRNPLEMEGTYPLPEAQLDRFLFNVNIEYPPEDDELEVLLQTTAPPKHQPTMVLHGDALVAYQKLVERVPIAKEVAEYALRIVRNSRPNGGSFAIIKRYVSWGASIRAGQNLIRSAKAKALLDGRSHPNFADIRFVALPVLRHRLILNFRAEADQVDADSVIEKLIDETQIPASGIHT